MPEIEAADQRARATWTSRLVTEVAGPGARAWWESAETTLAQKREIISSLATVRIMPATRGSRTFQPESIKVDWHDPARRATRSG